MAQDISDKKAMTPTFRVSFPAVFAPKSFEGGEPKYGLTMLFKKTADIEDLRRAANAAAIEKWGENKAKWPKNLRFPFRDGDEKSDRDGYAGHIFVGTTSKKKPGLIDQKKQPIIDEDAFYAGCYARATVIAFAYDTKGNKGVSFALLNVQKMKDGEQFSGRRAAQDEFDEVEDESEDQENYSDDQEDYDL